MRYRCLIYDEDERLDAGLRRLFTDLAVAIAEEPTGDEATTPRGRESADGLGVATRRNGAAPTSRMW